MAQLVSVENSERLRQDELRKKISYQGEIFGKKHKSGDFSFTEALNYERFIDFSEMVIQSSNEKILALEPEKIRIREQLVEATRDRKVVERIKEKRWKEYQYELNREIIKENDDINQKLYIQKRKQNFNE